MPTAFPRSTPGLRGTSLDPRVHMTPWEILMWTNGIDPANGR